MTDTDDFITDAEVTLLSFYIEYIKDDDGTIIVPGDIDFSLRGRRVWENLSNIIVEGTFDCSYHKLTSLAGLPKVIRGGLYCQNNPLTTLPRLPRSLTKLGCMMNPLQSLYGIHPSFVGEAVTPFGVFDRFAEIPLHLLLVGPPAGNTAGFRPKRVQP